MSADGGPLQRLSWYARRLRAMENGEMRWRATQVLQKIRPRENRTDTVWGPADEPGWVYALEQFRTADARPVLLDRDRAKVIADRAPALVSELIRLAERSADCSFSFFGYPAVSLGRPIDWHHDPFANLRWPDAPSHRIDHRVAAGDVKWIWELNRLQHLPWLAQAWLFTGDGRFSGAAFEHLDTWIDQNPPGRGIAWRGAFEAGLRSISISIALQGLRDAPQLTPDRYRRIVGMLGEGARRCWQERSLFSSANNHLIGEMAGLAVVAMMFPELRSAREWERDAVGTLSAEAHKQILADGAGAEQSIGYQMATAELLLVVAALLTQRDGIAPAPITDAIRRSSQFLAAVVGEHDPDPRYGDNDQEFALRLGPEPVRTVRDHLGLVAAMGLGVTGATDGAASLGAQWYRSPGQAAVAASLPAGSAEFSGSKGSFVAHDGGLVVLRSGRRRTTMDIGNVGYLSIAAHGHADALAVTLSVDGHDVIGDPGTGSYYQHPRWRAMMRGTRAHPTVCVDGEDQSVIGGPFMWTRHAQVRVLGVDLPAGVVDAEHDGYTRLPGRVVHRRWLISPPDARYQLVVDLITGTGNHEVRTCWPLHPSLHVERSGDGHVVSGGKPVVHLLHAATAPVTLQDSFGDEAADLGWWSDRMESRDPSWWLGAVCRTELPVVLATLIAPADGVVTKGLSVSKQRDLIDVRWSEDAGLRSVLVRSDGAAAVAHTAE